MNERSGLGCFIMHLYRWRVESMIFNDDDIIGDGLVITLHTLH